MLDRTTNWTTDCQSFEDEDAKVGSLWCFKPSVEGYIGNLPLFYLPSEDEKNPEHFINYNYVMIDDSSVVVKLGVVRQVKDGLYGTNTRLFTLYKVLAVTTTGEAKVGWVGFDFVLKLKKAYDEHG